jgi:hypothetical protein
MSFSRFYLAISSDGVAFQTMTCGDSTGFHRGGFHHPPVTPRARKPPGHCGARFQRVFFSTPWPSGCSCCLLALKNSLFTKLKATRALCRQTAVTDAISPTRRSDFLPAVWHVRSLLLVKAAPSGSQGLPTNRLMILHSRDILHLYRPVAQSP